MKLKKMLKNFATTYYCKYSINKDKSFIHIYNDLIEIELFTDRVGIYVMNEGTILVHECVIENECIKELAKIQKKFKKYKEEYVKGIQ